MAFFGSNECFLEQIPLECIFNIVSFLSPRDLLAFGATSRRNWDISTSPSLWERLFVSRWPEFSRRDDLGLATYRRFHGHLRTAKNSDVRVRRVRQLGEGISPARRALGGDQNALFSVRPVGDLGLVCGGVGQQVQIFADRTKAQRSPDWTLDAPTGLAMGLSGDEGGTLVTGGFDGNCSVTWNFDADLRRFLSNQSVRYLKQQLAIHRKDWSGLNEKSELVEKLMGSFGVSDTPWVKPSLEFRASDAALVDVLVEEDRIFAGGWSLKVAMYNVVPGRSVEKAADFVGHTEAVNCIRRFGNDAQHIFSASSDGTVRSWDVTTQQSPGMWVLSDQWIWCLEQADWAGNCFYAAGVDHLFRLVDTRTSKVQWAELLPDSVSGLSTVLSNELLATASFDGQCRLWDSRMRKCLWSQALSTERLTRCVLTATDVLCGSFDSHAYVIGF